MSGLTAPLGRLIDDGLPVFGTCAGMILLASEILWGAVVLDALGEPERARTRVRTHALSMGTGKVTHAPVLLIDLLEREPHRHGFARFEEEVETVLVWRRRHCVELERRLI